MNTVLHRTIASAAIFALLLASTSLGGEWARFRGPNGQGHSQDKTIPVKWTEKDYNWKIALPGKGHSSPVVWGDRIFISSEERNENQVCLLSLRASDGQETWRKEYALEKYDTNSLSSFAAGSPCVDADAIYVLFYAPGKTTLRAVSHDGEKLWDATFSGVRSEHGPGNSPMTVDDLVVFLHEQNNKNQENGENSKWIAVNRKTGKTTWEVAWANTDQISYSTPCVYRAESKRPLLIFTSLTRGVAGVDIATGKVAWEVPSALPKRVVGSPVIAGDLLIGSCGQGGGGVRLVAIRPSAAGDSAEEAYELKGYGAPYVPTPIVVDGLLFTYHDRGTVSCFLAATGEKIWEQKPGKSFYGSPVCVDGNLYCITREGLVTVIKASRSYELLSTHDLKEPSHATPAVADGRMYLRTFSSLISIGG